MSNDRLSHLIAQLATLRDRALVACNPVAFQKLDRAILRLSAAQTELRRGNHIAARAFAWSACDLLSLIRV
jgi:hypothetical protein